MFQPSLILSLVIIAGNALIEYPVCSDNILALQRLANNILSTLLKDVRGLTLPSSYSLSRFLTYPALFLQ